MAGATKRQAGYTLAELVVAMFAGSILMAGSYQGFNIISRQYDAVRAAGDVQDGGEAALNIIAGDLRKAGRLAYNAAGTAPLGAIDAPVTITSDDDLPCCDRVTVTFDEDTAVRAEVSYYVMERTFPETRYALYTDKIVTENGVRTTEYSGSYVADYIEAFHVTTKESNNAGNPLLVETELVMRAKTRGVFSESFATPAYASMTEYEAEDDFFQRKFFSKSVLLRNLEKF